MWHDTNLAHNLCKRINLNEFGLIKQKAFYYRLRSSFFLLFFCEQRNTLLHGKWNYVCVQVWETWRPRISICVLVGCKFFKSETIIIAIAFFSGSSCLRRIPVTNFVAKSMSHTHLPEHDFFLLPFLRCFYIAKAKNYLFRCLISTPA